MNTKYIPGDLVTYRGIVFQVDTNSAHNPFITLTNDNESGPNKYFVVTTEAFKVKDIPLTPEILEKNGWEKGEYEIYHKLVDSKHVICVMKEKDDKWNVSVGAVTLAYCKFIHEFQHLLFGLGLNSELKV